MTGGSPGRLDAWRRLVDDEACAGLRDAAVEADPGDVTAIARLRKAHDAELVAAALDLAAARRKARGKMPGHADRLIADPNGVEMATSTRIARLKASVLGRGSPGVVLDLCCGIGGDAIEFAAAGLDVLAIDLDPLRAWMAGRNAACEARAGDATAIDIPRGAAVHIDPSRRDERGKRTTRMDDMVPGPDAVRAIIERATVSAVKLAPGNEPTDLAPGQSHWVSEHGRLVQALLWRGVDLERGAGRLATMFEGDTPRTVAGDEGQPPMTDEEGGLVFTMDPALERARLAHVVAARHGLVGLANPGTGLLTGADDTVRDPWLVGYRVHARMAWNPRRVRAWLRDHGAGIVAVKTRGGSVDPDTVQGHLRGPGDRPFVVFVQRLGSSQETLITERVSSVHADER